MPESPAVPKGHPVEVAAANLAHRAASYQLSLARGALLAQLQIEARALRSGAQRLLDALDQAEAVHAGFIIGYVLQLQADGSDLQDIFDPHPAIPDTPEGLDHN